MMKWKYLIQSASMGFAAFLLGPSLASAQVDLGTAANFAVLGGPAVTCTDSVVEGDVGALGVVTTTACTISGTVHEGDVAAIVAYRDFLRAYEALEDTEDYLCTDFLNTAYTGESLTLAPGVYCNEAAVTFTNTTLTLDAGSDANPVWIFKIGTLGTGALTGTGLTVIMAGGGETCNNNVFWWTAEAATLTDSTFLGTILSGAGITVSNSTTPGGVDGQALATEDVTLTDTEVSWCGAPPQPPQPPKPSHCKIKVTGGGQIPVPGYGRKARASFGFNAKGNKDGTATGHFNYLNHVSGLHVNGSVDHLVVSERRPNGSPKTVLFSGTCRHMPACTFEVAVQDNGEPGRRDEFGITVDGGLFEVTPQSVISRGNIQFHKSCGKDRHGRDDDKGGCHRDDDDGHGKKGKGDR